jgi:putative membrane protein
MTPTILPVVNAVLNATACCLLVIGFLLIKRRQYAAHGWVMCSAFSVSAAFLTCYLTYHARYGEKTSGLPPGGLRNFYLYIILLPHVLLAIVMVPMILRTLYFAYRRNWIAHTRISRPTFWIWLYVSVTGVVVYWMLYHLFPKIVGSS